MPTSVNTTNVPTFPSVVSLKRDLGDILFGGRSVHHLSIYLGTGAHI